MWAAILGYKEQMYICSYVLIACVCMCVLCECICAICALVACVCGYMFMPIDQASTQVPAIV